MEICYRLRQQQTEKKYEKERKKHKNDEGLRYSIFYVKYYLRAVPKVLLKNVHKLKLSIKQIENILKYFSCITKGEEGSPTAT